jgi:uncharacterized protein (DUF2062 family)
MSLTQALLVAAILAGVIAGLVAGLTIYAVGYLMTLYRRARFLRGKRIYDNVMGGPGEGT